MNHLKTKQYPCRPLLTALTLTGLLSVSMISTGVSTAGMSFLSAAHAAEDGHSGGRSGGGGHDTGSTHVDGHTDDHDDTEHGSRGGPGAKGGPPAGKGGAHAGAGSQRLVDSVFRGKGRDHLDSLDDTEERPDWAGGGGKPGTGAPAGSGGKKGDIYGELAIILRDENGEPVLDNDGRVQFLDADGNVIPYNAEGEVSDPTGLQEVELGRLNVGRAPASVLARALAEAERTMALDADGVMETDAAGRIVVEAADGEVYTIDSPVENLALYVEAMTNPEESGWTLQQAASFLAAAANKYGEINLDMVVYTNTILGINNPEDAYYDLTGFTYDRGAVYDGEVTYWVDNGDGTASQVTEPLMDAVFDGQTYQGTAADAFARAADDARAVIEFIHEPIH
ncbi:hypothetical protein [Guyparkeria sp.]|uniref:hypothetical protein n=1 Tax=Guyparkeria sp. TaxID=2035736 RepID=UPI003970B661